MIRPGRLTRRGLGAISAASLLSACGFHPLYGPAASGATSPAQAGLAAISIGLIPERAGQLLRQALEERFERGGASVSRRYDLQVAFAIASEGISIQPDNSSTRTRITGTATWKLVSQDSQRATLASGVSRDVDGLNVINNQYFAADLNSETVVKRIAEAVADEMTLRLAAYFDRQAEPAAKTG